MDKCVDCKWKYPDHYLDKMYMNGSYTDPICGICALERLNVYHGVKLTKFRGEMAEAKRLDAIAWRKNHPKDKPND